MTLKIEIHFVIATIEVTGTMPASIVTSAADVAAAAAYRFFDDDEG
jgi:hypothetical protein